MIGQITEQIAVLTRQREKIRELLKQNGAELPETVKKPCYSMQAKSLKEMRVACVADAFTRNCYAPECNLLDLTPEGWMNELKGFSPDMLFIESAWEGKDKLWYRKISRPSPELYDMSTWCHENNIPVVFWNKEDPVYTSDFLSSSALADYVFTTDIDSVGRYKSELGHDRVFHLHFAAQPSMHNPIELYDRKNRFCFAGAYYHRYTERAKVFDAFAELFISGAGLDIYDRNYGNARPEHAFPDRYAPYILGKLEHCDIAVAYKGYEYGINMSSINQSQTMFARRAFELMASNTIVVGNFSRGLKNYFGDLTICTNDVSTLQNRLEACCGDAAARRGYRLAALREVLSHHLYEDRLAAIVKAVFGVDLYWKPPLITVLAGEESEAVRAMFDAQNYPNKQLLFSDEDSLLPSDGFIALFHPEDFYGRDYLTDMALAVRYGEWDAVGKPILPDEAYRSTGAVSPRRALIRAKNVSDMRVSDFLRQGPLSFAKMIVVDEFDYAEKVAKTAVIEIDEAQNPDPGIPLAEIERTSNDIQALVSFASGYESLLPEQMAALLSTKGDTLSMRREQDCLILTSSLQNEKHEYLYMSQKFDLSSFVTDEHLSLYFNGEGNMDVIAVCVFMNSMGENISPSFLKWRRQENLPVPPGAACFKLGFRPKGRGEFRVREIKIGTRVGTWTERFLARSNVLVLSNIYPSYDNLYRNMFVHSRVKAYRKAGLICEVVQMNLRVKDGYREFDGIDVFDGGSNALARALESGKIDTVCVHFLDRNMWGVLREYADKVRVLVWVHGAEIQPWHRREYNCISAAEREAAMTQSAERMEFWREVFGSLDNMRLHFVFVSRYFAEEVMEDYGLRLPENHYSVIHNGIDTELFAFVPKSSKQRKKILSIRPYASRTYANDLTVRCIQILAKKTFFKKLEFHLLGDGELFDETLRPLRRYSNVKIEKTFLRREQIAKLKREYGIFLVPTRMDSHGVSRDEAMSSGLVPVTNAVAAIPEFVDEHCGILAPPEDAVAMAEGIERLYYDPDLFERMSSAAAARVRRQSAAALTVEQDLRLIRQTE